MVAQRLLQGQASLAQPALFQAHRVAGGPFKAGLRLELHNVGEWPFEVANYRWVDAERGLYRRCIHRLIEHHLQRCIQRMLLARLRCHQNHPGRQRLGYGHRHNRFRLGARPALAGVSRHHWWSYLTRRQQRANDEQERNQHCEMLFSQSHDMPPTAVPGS